MKYDFISLEGIDGTGKSTIAKKIADEVIRFGKTPYLTRDPVREINPWADLYNIFERSERIDKLSEALLLLSSRVDNSRRRIKPALDQGNIVIADRFHDSWFAYQSIRLSEYFGNEMKALDYLISQHEILVNKGLLLEPDKTFIFKVDPEISMQRVTERSAKIKKSKYDILKLQKRVAEQYDIISNRFPSRISVIDTENKNLEEVSEETMIVLGFYQH